MPLLQNEAGKQGTDATVNAIGATSAFAVPIVAHRAAPSTSRAEVVEARLGPRSPTPHSLTEISLYIYSIYIFFFVERLYIGVKIPVSE